MTDLSVIILVGREERHIRRCLAKLAPLEPRQVLVVESQKGDRTHEIAIETAKCLNWRVEECLNERIGECLNERGVGERCRCTADGLSSSNQTIKQSNNQTILTTVWHDWPGLHAKQFNWALDALDENEKCEERNEKCGEWILRLDADEYLTDETIEKLKQFLICDTNSRKADRADGGIPPGVGTSLFAKFCVSPSGDLRSNDIAGLTLELKRRFCGGEIRHATNGIRLLRLWRRGRGKSEERAMDEHIAIDGISDLDELRRLGKVVDFDGAFYDDNLNDMNWWREKHRGYAKREAADALAFARGELRFKPIKERYYRLPQHVRAVAYFCIRYFLKGGFLDGYAGWMWNFWQGLWYRWIVDVEIGRMKGHCRFVADGIA